MLDGADRKAINEGLKVISRDLGLELDLEAIKAHKPAAEKALMYNTRGGQIERLWEEAGKLKEKLQNADGPQVGE